MIPVVLLHAFPLDGRMWMHQANALSDRFEIVVPDLRGFGGAYAELGGLSEISIDLAADDIAKLLDERGIHNAVIGGISRGGYIALAFARRHPERLRGLMLFDTRATPADEKEKQTWSQVTDRLASEGMGFLPDQMKSRLFGATALDQNQKLVQRVNEIILSQKADAVRAAATGMANRPDARSGLARIGVPVLAVAGTEDGAFEDTRAIAGAIPQAEFVAVENAGHLCAMERPEFVTEAMRQFLTRLT